MNRLFTLSAGLALLIGGASTASAAAFETAMTARIFTFERLLSSLKIETKQEPTSTRTASYAEQASYKALANSITEVDRAAEVRRAMQRYESMQTAVSGSCSDVAASKNATRAESNASGIMATVSQQERKWASEGGSRVDIMAGTQSARQSFLCSSSEAAAGLCEEGAHRRFGGVPAGDSDVSTFMLRTNNNGVRSYGDVEAQVGMIYMDNLLPMPTIPKKSEADKAGITQQIDRASAMRQLAIISLGRASVSSLIVRGLEGGTE